MLDYLVLYDSQSGNTKKIAAAIFSALPGTSKDLMDLTSTRRIPEASVYFVGYCVHRGTCPMEVSDFLSGLKDCPVALFGTCGMGNSPEYYRAIASSAAAWIDESCRYLGTYLCQGKMPLQVRDKYEKNRTEENAAQMDRFIQNFDMAMTHPDDTDCRNAQAFALECLEAL